MIDFSKGPIPLRPATAAELRDALARELPSPVEVKLVEGKPSKIEIREGLWRGLVLVVSPGDRRLELTAYQYVIPTFGTKALLFVLSVVIFSMILMVAVSIVVGEFVPMIGGVGGIAGFMMYSAVKTIVLKNVRSGWSPVTERAIGNVTS